MEGGLMLGCLGRMDNSAKQRLGSILWNWNLCGQCDSRVLCSRTSCPWQQKGDLSAFWDLSERMTDAYTPECLGRRAALKDHQELLDIIGRIKTGRNVSRIDLLQEIFENDPDEGKPPTLYDQNRAFNIAASLLLLMDFGVLHDAANFASANTAHALWRDGLSVDAFIKETFPIGHVNQDIQVILPELRAKNLSKHAKLRLKSTNDIRRHLLLDKRERTVWVFHQSTVLRQLLSTTDDGGTALLPREMMLEVLDTIHLVLFPASISSQKLLAYHVVKNGWDKGLLSDMSKPYRADDDPATAFRFFGVRLKELYEELQAPTPHGWLQRRLKRRSETYMLMATMYGVIIVVTLGFLSLVAAIFQSWVAWQQWKHPVN
ncbi:hypothetical protein HBI47_074680 [Parastagonospora nodorum]|nr:hypothetical protein HBI47_074680 [Parastagonospora nodorum]